MTAAGRAVKRLIDIVGAVTALILLSPLMLVLTVLVRIFLGTPVLFRQVRPGLHTRSFTILKFRTMSDRRDSTGRLLPDDERTPAFGRWLRRTSLDELPQLVNVLRGELSLVGPRPLLPEYLPRYTSEQARRHAVKPGLTGWAQVNGRNELTWEEKFALDTWYVDHQSIALDFRILITTARRVLERKGIEGAGNVPFEGGK